MEAARPSFFIRFNDFIHDERRIPKDVSFSFQINLLAYVAFTYICVTVALFKSHHNGYVMNYV